MKQIKFFKGATLALALATAIFAVAFFTTTNDAWMVAFLLSGVATAAAWDRYCRLLMDSTEGPAERIDIEPLNTNTYESTREQAEAAAERLNEEQNKYLELEAKLRADSRKQENS